MKSPCGRRKEAYFYPFVRHFLLPSGLEGYRAWLQAIQRTNYDIDPDNVGSLRSVIQIEGYIARVKSVLTTPPGPGQPDNRAKEWHGRIGRTGINSGVMELWDWYPQDRILQVTSHEDLPTQGSFGGGEGRFWSVIEGTITSANGSSAPCCATRQFR